MITLALPKGRLAKTLGPLLAEAGLTLEDAYFSDDDRRLIYATADPTVRVIPVKPFDVGTIVASHGAELGIVGADVLEEFDFSEVYAPLAFPFGACRLSVAGPADFSIPAAGQALRVATKYPRSTLRYFESLGISPTIIPMSGALELAPALGIADCIVDLVSTGATLAANDLVEGPAIMHSTARLIVGRQAYKSRGTKLHDLVKTLAKIADTMGETPA